MNNQYVQKGIQKQKKVYLMMLQSKMIIAKLVLVFNDRAGDDVTSVQKTDARERDISFLELSRDTTQTRPFS